MTMWEIRAYEIHQRLGSFFKRDFKNATETVGELADVCKVRLFAKITKNPIVGETPPEEKLEKLITDVM